MKFPTAAQTATLVKNTRAQAQFMADLGSPDGVAALDLLDRMINEAAGTGQDVNTYLAVGLVQALSHYAKTLEG